MNRYLSTIVLTIIFFNSNFAIAATIKDNINGARITYKSEKIETDLFGNTVTRKLELTSKETVQNIFFKFYDSYKIIDIYNMSKNKKVASYECELHAPVDFNRYSNKSDISKLLNKCTAIYRFAYNRKLNTVYLDNKDADIVCDEKTSLSDLYNLMTQYNNPTSHEFSYKFSVPNVVDYLNGKKQDKDFFTLYLRYYPDIANNSKYSLIEKAEKIKSPFPMTRFLVDSCISCSNNELIPFEEWRKDIKYIPETPDS